MMTHDRSRLRPRSEIQSGADACDGSGVKATVSKCSVAMQLLLSDGRSPDKDKRSDRW